MMSVVNVSVRDQAAVGVPRLLQPDLINVLIDGQFGSTGKGLFAGYIAMHQNVDLAITNASPNAGHTYKEGAIKSLDGKQVTYEKEVVAYHLPISGIVNRNATIYLCAGAVIDPWLLLKEIEEHKIRRGRIYVDPRAAWLTSSHRDQESDDKSTQTRLASTRKGVGAALADKVARRHDTIGGCQMLRNHVIFGTPQLNDYRWKLMEVPQGMDLGLNYGLSYPHCTSREVSLSQALSDLGVHPRELGHSIVTLRSYPIRVGHIFVGETRIGDSGPFYDDQHELSWKMDLGLEPELTTVTKRERRIATFSEKQLVKAATMLRPDVVFYNFANYGDDESNSHKIRRIRYHCPAAHLFVGNGPSREDVTYVPL